MAEFWAGFGLAVLALAAVGLGGIALRSSGEIRAARARVKSLGSQVIETDGGPIEYARVGQGYPILTVHGAMGGFDQGLWLANSFGLTRHQVIAVSRMGYLGTPLPAGASLNSQADAYACLLDALGIQRAAVFAASAGTTSAIRFAARHPERVSALVLLSPDAPGEVQMPLPPRFFFDTLLRSDFVYWVLITLFGKWVQNAIGLVPKGYPLTAEQAAMVKRMQAGDLPVSRRIDGMIFETYTCADDFQESASPDSPYPLSQIKIPVLAINAADDPISIPQNMRRLVEPLPNARLFVVPDGGHFLFGHAQAARTAVDQFLCTSVPELKGDS